MNKEIKIGLWVPRREDTTKTIDEKNPASIDFRIHELFMDYLEESGATYFNNLDFRKAYIKNDQVFIGSFCLNDLDHLLWFGDIDRSLDSYDLEVLRVLSLSVKMHNPFSFYIEATDKFSAFSILHKHAIPVSDLFLVNQENLGVLEPLFENDSFLLKPRRSGWGLGIIKVDSFNHLRDIIEYHPKKNYYLEKFYPNNLSDWTGVSVVNGTVIYGFRKNISKISGWKVYDENKTGGDVTYVKPSEEIERIALKIGEILGANFYGLDFIKTTEGYKIVDINCSPGIYYDLIQDLNIPIAELFFKSIELIPSEIETKETVQV